MVLHLNPVGGLEVMHVHRVEPDYRYALAIAQCKLTRAGSHIFLALSASLNTL